MTRYRGHYLPMAAKREVLRIYRNRRTSWVPMSNGPLTPLAAMDATVRYFQDCLAYNVAFPSRHFPESDVQHRIDCFRVAEHYRDLLRDKPAAFKHRPPRVADVARARQGGVHQ